VEEVFENDSSPYAGLMKSMKRLAAAEFSRAKSKMVSDSQARVVRQGFKHGGPPPLGLKRVLVRLDGQYCQDLGDGDRKTLGNMRVKLAPGDPVEIAVVRRIFQEYVEDQRSLLEIASGLNTDGITGRRGGQWAPGSVSYILSNPAYSGAVRYSLWRGGRRSQFFDLRGDSEPDTIVTTRDAHEAIVSAKFWCEAQKRLGARTHRKTNAALGVELRALFEKWGFVSADAVNASPNACWSTYGNRFERGYSDALAQACETEISEAVAKVRSGLVDDHLDVKDIPDDGWLVNNVLHIRTKVGWPRAAKYGIQWDFAFSGCEVEDVTLCLGFAPAPHVKHVETFVIMTQRGKRHAHHLKPNVFDRGRLRGRRLPADGSLLSPLRHALQWRSRRAETAFCEALKQYDVVNLAKLARDLGWSPDAVRRMYLRMKTAGLPVPPLKMAHGRRILVTCPDCGWERSLTPAAALALTTGICRRCHCTRLQRSGAARARMFHAG
jgi:hypothetical protein